MRRITESDYEWIMMAVIYGGGEKGADIDALISAADYVNHALPDYDTCKAGIKFLLRKGIIKIVGESVVISEEVKQKYLAARSNRSVKNWELCRRIIEDHLEIADNAEGQENQFINEHKYETALQNYLDRNRVL